MSRKLCAVLVFVVSFASSVVVLVVSLLLEGSWLRGPGFCCLDCLTCCRLGGNPEAGRQLEEQPWSMEGRRPDEHHVSCGVEAFRHLAVARWPMRRRASDPGNATE